MDYQVKVHNYKNKLSFKNKFSRLIWNLSYLLLFWPFKTRFLNFWRVFILRLFGAKIGVNCSVDSDVKIWAPWNLIMHDHSLIAKKVNCYNPDKIIIHSETIISEGVFLCAASHNIYSSSHELVTKPIVIKDQVWIGVNAFIMMGVTIGQGAVVGATASVYKDVAPWTVVGGNPSKFIKKRKILD
ncbi:MAG: putative colanic acid biosynthesis acetyltransferase [Bacteroidota bacterium]